MSETHCISFPTLSPVLVMRQDFIRICDGNHCAAAVLSQFMHWHEVKLKHHAQATQTNRHLTSAGLHPSQETDCWVWKSVAELHEELLGCYGKTTIRDAIKFLLDKKFLEDRENSIDRWDRTRQFLFQVEAVQNAVNGGNTGTTSHLSDPVHGHTESGASSDTVPTNAFTESDTSTSQNQQIINVTEITTETTSKTTTETVPVRSSSEENLSPDERLLAKADTLPAEQFIAEVLVVYPYWRTKLVLVLGDPKIRSRDRVAVATLKNWLLGDGRPEPPRQTKYFQPSGPALPSRFAMRKQREKEAGQS